jgi:hypothetical protein
MRHDSARFRKFRARLIVAAVAIAVVACSNVAFAQDYQVAKPSKTEAQSKQLSAQVATILRGAGAPDAAGQTALKDYFIGYLYPSMTSYDPLALGQLSKKREDLFQRFINTAKSPQARDIVIAHTIKAMTAIAKGGYHPAVRYNAALILGQLDAQPGVKALPAGTEEMLSFLENDQFNKVPVPTSLKVAALVSLQRHLRMGVEPPIAERITKAALAIANREDLPDDVSAKAFGWVRRQAAALLAMQFEKGLTPPVHQTFVRLVRDEKADIDDRCTMAQLLKPTMYAEAQGLNVQDMALALADLARDVMAIEDEEADEYIDQMVGGAVPMGGGFGGEGGFGGRGAFGGEGGYMGRGGFGGEGGGGFNLALQDQGPTFEKRRMIDRTLAVANGAQAVAAGSPDELKQRLTDLSTMFVQVAEGAAPDNVTIDEIAKAVSDLRNDVDRLVTAWAPAAAPADEVIEEEEAPAAAEGAEEPAAAAEAPAEAAG